MALLAHTPQSLVTGLATLTPFSSALAPAAMAAMTRAGAMAHRLALRLRWQTMGWMLSGVAAEYLYGRGRLGWPLTLALSGTGAPLLATQLNLDRSEWAPPPASLAGPRSWRRFLPLLAFIRPVFLVAAGSEGSEGNEGLFASFALYLWVIRLPIAWVG